MDTDGAGTQIDRDRDLATRVAGGNQQAFDAFFREYFPRFTVLRSGAWTTTLRRGGSRAAHDVHRVRKMGASAVKRCCLPGCARFAGTS